VNRKKISSETSDAMICARIYISRIVLH